MATGDVKTNEPAANEVEDGDAADLRFPKEFEEAETLLNAEVYLLLEHRKEETEMNVSC